MRALRERGMDGKQCNRQRGPTEPRPKDLPARQRIGSFHAEADPADFLRAARRWFFGSDFNVPPTRLRQFEAGRIKEFVCRGVGGRAKLANLFGLIARVNANANLAVRLRLSRGGCLQEDADFHRAGPKWIWRRKDSDSIIPGLFREANCPAVGNGRNMARNKHDPNQKKGRYDCASGKRASRRQGFFSVFVVLSWFIPHENSRLADPRQRAAHLHWLENNPQGSYEQNDDQRPPRGEDSQCLRSAAPTCRLCDRDPVSDVQRQ